ncbi:MAG: dienelactone hydrolase [Nonlabens sp.]|jgi:dienelactone hydrolase
MRRITTLKLTIFGLKYVMKKLLLLLLFIPLFSFGQTFDYSYSDGQNFELAEFRFWKPSSNNDYKGVLVIVPGFNWDGRKAVLDSVWQSFATKHNFLIAACHFKDYEVSKGKPKYREVSKGSGEVLLTAIKSYSTTVSKKYINDLPLLFFGMSAGGQYNYEFACWKPEKVLSFVVNKGGYYQTGIAPIKTHKVPGIFFIGEDDKYYRNDMIQGIYSVNRNLGANWTLIIEKNTKHSIKNSKNLSIAFFESILPQRLSNTNSLLDINRESSLLGVPEKKIIRSLKELGQTDYLTIWLPNEYFGNIWLESL